MRMVAGAVMVLAVGLPILIIVLPTLIAEADAARTESESFSDNCTTGAAETSCDVALPSENAYSTMDSITVTETSPGAGDRTGDSSLALDRVTLTIAALATSTTYGFDVAHRIVDPDISDQANEALSRYGLLIAIAVIGAILFWGYRTFL